MIRETVEALPSLIDTLKNEERKIFLYGMGNGAEKIYAYLICHGIEIDGVVASDGFVRGQDFLGFKVISITEASERYGSLCLILCFGLEGEKSHFLTDLANNHRILSPNLPVFGDGACDKDFILENAESFERVYEMLADGESKEIFLNILKYNVTGEIAFLEKGKSLDCPEEFYNHEKRHIDVGAYDGDTVLEFTEHSDKYNDIVAFEPDVLTFRHFKRNTEDIRDCIGINAAVGRYDRKVSFASGGGRASHCEAFGEGTVDCVSIDKFCGFTHINASGTPVGSIKIDAEGMDEDVICGAVNTIYCCKPHLAVALYHRASDLIDLPLLIRKHYHKYEFYLRKKEYVPAWDIFLYAIKR
ncbi:MAG: FkbM family methyltransferase [Clostridia bacterium]|nr:FkbM family methyltransferase [Clostridia bacterium]